MWIDERGSEVLSIAECRRLLALGAKEHHHGHLGIPKTGAPLVLPVDYAVEGTAIVIQLGAGLFDHVNGQLVAFQVDSSSHGVGCDPNDEDARFRWSVLVRGLASELDSQVTLAHLPAPRVADPGHRLVHIRSDVVTGRRLRADADGAPGPLP